MPGATPTVFPGRTIKAGATDRSSVLLIQHRLNQIGCGPVAESGVFNKQTETAVKLFQVRSLDPKGIPLVVDGKVGPLTWGALFGAETLPAVDTPLGSLAGGALEIAGGEVGVREDPPGFQPRAQSGRVHS